MKTALVATVLLFLAAQCTPGKRGAGGKPDAKARADAQVVAVVADVDADVDAAFSAALRTVQPRIKRLIELANQSSDLATSVKTLSDAKKQSKLYVALTIKLLRASIALQEQMNKHARELLVTPEGKLAKAMGELTKAKMRSEAAHAQLLKIEGVKSLFFAQLQKNKELPILRERLAEQTKRIARTLRRIKPDPQTPMLTRVRSKTAAGMARKGSKPR